jgi:hypothetical protein
VREVRLWVGDLGLRMSVTYSEVGLFSANDFTGTTTCFRKRREIGRQAICSEICARIAETWSCLRGKVNWVLKEREGTEDSEGWG